MQVSIPKIFSTSSIQWQAVGNPIPYPLHQWWGVGRRICYLCYEQNPKNWDALGAYPKFKPSQQNVYKPFDSFTALIENQVEKVIMSMPSKSCVLDALTAKVLKELMKPLLPVLTKTVNLSLVEGVFIEEWKLAIIHSLLKELGVDLISKIYRPVSNLSFLSKAVDQNLTRFIKETLYIRVNNPSLNRNIGKYHLPHIWDEVLLNISELKLK